MSQAEQVAAPLASLPADLKASIEALVNLKVAQSREEEQRSAAQLIEHLRRQHQVELAARDETLRSFQTQLETTTNRVGDAQEVLAGASDRGSLIDVDVAPDSVGGHGTAKGKKGKERAVVARCTRPSVLATSRGNASFSNPPALAPSTIPPSRTPRSLSHTPSSPPPSSRPAIAPASTTTTSPIVASPDPRRSKKLERVNTTETTKPTGEKTHYSPAKAGTNAKRLHIALGVHVRVLANVSDPHTVLPTPTPEDLERFAMRFGEEAQHRENQRIIANALPTDARPLLRAFKFPRSRNGVGIEHGISQIVTDRVTTALAQHSLQRWAPIFSESAYSRWNELMRSTALDTFKSAIAAGGYDTLSYFAMPNGAALESAYNHVVHWLEKEKWRKTLLNPTAIADEADDAASRQRRSRLLRKRNLITEGTLYADIFAAVHKGDTYMASDDEDVDETLTGGRKVKTSVACKSPWRSDCEEALVSAVEMQRSMEVQMALAPGRRSGATHPLGRLRPAVHLRPDATLHHIPTRLPIDRYRAAWFNKLSPAAKRRLCADTTRLTYPPDAKDVIFPEPCPANFGNDVGLELFKLYGSEVLARYELDNIDDPDYEAMDADEDDEESGDEESEDEESEEMDDEND